MLTNESEWCVLYISCSYSKIKNNNVENNNINCNEVAKAYVVLQKYTEALELNAYDAETYLKRAAAYMKLSNNQGI